MQNSFFFGIYYLCIHPKYIMVLVSMQIISITPNIFKICIIVLSLKIDKINILNFQSSHTHTHTYTNNIENRIIKMPVDLKIFLLELWTNGNNEKASKEEKWKEFLRNELELQFIGQFIHSRVNFQQYIPQYKTMHSAYS